LEKIKNKIQRTKSEKNRKIENRKIEKSKNRRMKEVNATTKTSACSDSEGRKEGSAAAEVIDG